MKAIKIAATQLVAIQAALRAANGVATAHTLCDADEVLRIVEKAESLVVAAVGAKRHAPGARYSHTSGDAVANAYKFSRQGTTIVLERRSSDWYLVDVLPATVWAQGGRAVLTLTADQDAAAIAHLRKGYAIARPTQAAPAL